MAYKEPIAGIPGGIEPRDSEALVRDRANLAVLREQIPLNLVRSAVTRFLRSRELARSPAAFEVLIETYEQAAAEAGLPFGDAGKLRHHLANWEGRAANDAEFVEGCTERTRWLLVRYWVNRVLVADELCGSMDLRLGRSGFPERPDTVSAGDWKAMETEMVDELRLEIEDVPISARACFGIARAFVCELTARERWDLIDGLWLERRGEHFWVTDGNSAGRSSARARSGVSLPSGPE